MTSPLPLPKCAGVRAALVRVWPALALAVCVYLPWLGSPLFLDDWHLLWMASQADWSWSGLVHSFTFLDPGSIVTWNLPAGPAYHYFRPLVVALLKVEYAVFGTAPWGYHMVSLVLHLVSVVLVGLLTIGVTGSERVGRLAALLFALQPHNVASVNWTAGQTEALGAPLMLAALVSYVAARRGGFLLHGWTLMFTALACLTKENAVLVGAYAGVLELTLLVLGPEGWREWLKRAVPGLGALAVLLGGFLVYRFFVFDSGGGLIEPYFTSPAADGFVLFAAAKMVHYLGALITTAPIVPLFGTQFIAEHPLALASGGVVGVSFLVLLGRKVVDPRTLWLGLGWLAVAFLPTLPILASDLYPYFAGVGYALLLAGALAREGRVARVLLVSLVALYLVSTTGRGLLYHVQGVADRTAADDIEADNGGPLDEPATLLFVNMPVAVSHVTSNLRLRSGNPDILGVLVTLTPEWALPEAGPEVQCLGPAHVRIGPPPGHDRLFETPEEWNVHLYREPLVQGKRYETDHGFDAEPLWDGDGVVALDLRFDSSLSGSGVHIISYYLADDGRLAHRMCP